MAASAFESVLTLFIMIGTGYYMTGKSWFAKSGSDIFCKYASYISIPCYMVYNVISSFPNRQSLQFILRYLPIPLTVILLSFFFALMLASVFKVAPHRRGVFINGVSFSNVVLVGFPIINSIFGQSAVPYGMVYYMGNTVLFWTLGIYLLRRDGGQQGSLFSVRSLKQFFSLPMLGLFVGIALVVLGISLPGFIFSSLERIGQTTTPVALMFIGSILRLTDFKKMQLTKDLLVIVLVRLLFAPALLAFVFMLLPIDVLMKQVFFTLGAMPAMTQLGIMSCESGSDYEFASLVVATTSAVCLPALPLYMLLIDKLGLFV